MTRDYSDEEITLRLLKHAQFQGFNKWFGIELLAAGNGQVEVEVAVRPELTQHHGYVHGGCVSSLADTAAAWAAATAAKTDVVTSNFSFHFLAPAKGSHIRAHARTLKCGRRQATVEVQVFVRLEDGSEKLCGAGIATIAVLGRLAA